MKAFALPNQCLGLSFENITARKQIEAQLQQSLHYTQQIIEAMPGIVFVYDLIEQQSVYTSRQITDLLGYTSEQLQVMGKDVLARIIHADDIPHLSAYLETFRTATDGIVNTIEYRAHHANGEYRWINSQSVVFNRTAEGVPRQILGVSTDISERKQAETELRQSEERLSLATSGAGMGTWDANLQTGRAIWNEQHFRLLGYEPVLSGEATIELWHSRLHPEDLDRTMQAIEQAQQNQTLYRCEHRIIRADNGQVVWLAEFGQFFYNDAGQAIRLVGVSFDISERKRAELALRESEERLRRAIAIETVGVIFFKIDGGITDANDAFLWMSGYSREDFEQGRVRWDKMTPPEWMPHSLRAVEEFISKGYTTPYENEHRGTKDEQTAVSLTPPALPLSNVRVLVVDDEVDTRELIAFVLEHAGAIVTSVPSALAALDVLARSKPDVLVSDIGMPEMDGYMLMQQMQAILQGKQIVAIALTAYAGEIDRQQALAAGFQQHLSKPIEPKMLVQTIATLVEKDE